MHQLGTKTKEGKAQELYRVRRLDGELFMTGSMGVPAVWGVLSRTEIEKG
jgi:hypothetical protein